MMTTVDFFNKDNGISSTRTTIGQGKSKVSLTQYHNSTRGGTTFRSPQMTSRVNNRGQSLSYGFKANGKMTYIKSKNKVSNTIAPF